MKHSMKMMWGCVAVIVLVAILAATGSGTVYVLFALPSALMIAAMVWMMMRGMGGGSRSGGATLAAVPPALPPRPVAASMAAAAFRSSGIDG